jgi:uncharacterized membrane protein YqjE
MSGFLASARKAFADGLEAVQNRVELFGVELREEKWRFVETVVLVLAAFFLAMMAILLLSATILFRSRMRRVSTWPRRYAPPISWGRGGRSGA